MAFDSDEIGDLKRKIRKLKKVECKIRFGGETDGGKPLVWDSFFNLRGAASPVVKYPLARLAAMGRDEYKRVADEFFAYVYYEYYMENGYIFDNAYARRARAEYKPGASAPGGGAGRASYGQPAHGCAYPPQTLALLDLPYDSGYADIKKRFRELAKKYHPDTGGDADKFIELMRAYEALAGM